MITKEIKTKIEKMINSINNLTIDVNEPYNENEDISASKLIIDFLEDVFDSAYDNFFDLYEIRTAQFGKKVVDKNIIYFIPFSVVTKEGETLVMSGKIKAEAIPFTAETGAIKKVTIFNIEKAERCLL